MAAPRSPSAPRSILVVDDADTVRTLVALQLRPALPGFTFRQAKNGLQALEEIVAEPPAALLLDVNMPKLDGTAILLLLRRAFDRAAPALRAALQGGAGAGGAAARIFGVDPATRRVRDPFHPRRGAYEDDAVDEALQRLLEELQEEFGVDLDLGPDAVRLPSLPHYLPGEVLGREEIRAIPVVLLTTLARPSDRERFDRLGPPDGYLPKPFDAAEAGRLISRLVAH